MISVVQSAGGHSYSRYGHRRCNLLHYIRPGHQYRPHTTPLRVPPLSPWLTSLPSILCCLVFSSLFSLGNGRDPPYRIRQVPRVIQFWEMCWISPRASLSGKTSLPWPIVTVHCEAVPPVMILKLPSERHGRPILATPGSGYGRPE